MFLQKSKKLDFSWKIFWRRKLLFGNRDDFFPDRCPVDEHSFRRFLKYFENRAIFEFFSVLFLKRVAQSFSNTLAGNTCRAIALFFLFQSPSFLKDKCIFLMRFFTKNRLKHRIIPRFFRFPIFVGGAAGHSILVSVLLQKKNLKKIRISCRDISYFIIDCFFFLFTGIFARAA